MKWGNERGVLKGCPASQLKQASGASLTSEWNSVASPRQRRIGEHLVMNLRKGLSQRAIESIAGTRFPIRRVIFVESRVAHIRPHDCSGWFEQGQRELDGSVRLKTIHAKETGELVGIVGNERPEFMPAVFAAPSSMNGFRYEVCSTFRHSARM